MTNIPGVEERVEEIDEMIYGANLNITQNEYVRLSNEMRPKLIKLLTADRTALLTELRDSELLEEKVSDRTKDVCRTCDEYIPSCTCEAHNVLARAIKAHLDERIKYTSI